MNDRQTPETDAAKFQIGDSNHFAVHVVHARRLERERDEAREQIIGWENKWKCAIELAAQSQVERDEARDSAEQARAFKRVLKDDNAKLRRELATERALADRLAKSLHRLAKCCPTVKCEHLHHPPKDRHSYDNQCPVEQRYQESVNHGLQNYGVWKEARNGSER